MPKKYKIMTIMGTRPEIIRLSETIKAIDKKFNQIIVHTGQNYDYELNEIFFKDLSLRKPDYFLNVVGNNLGETMGNIISKSYSLMNEVKPDAVLVLGDTNSCLSVISAKRHKIPIFHMEAGNRCWDQNVPEMTNRKIVDHTSDINMPYSHMAYFNLIHEGLPLNTLFITGSPIKEVLLAHQKEIDNSKVLDELHLEPHKYIVMSIHREENVDNLDNLLEVFTSLNYVADYYKLPVIFSCHPRSKKRLEDAKFKFSPYIKIHKPFGFLDYGKLEKEAFLILSDSGTITEESSILNVPSVLVRTSTERQEGVVNHVITISGRSKNGIMDSCKRAFLLHQDKHPTVPEYEVMDVSQKVCEIIEKYIPIVNKKVWLKKE